MEKKNDIINNYITIVNTEFKNYINIIYGNEEYNEMIFKQYMDKYIEKRYIKVLSVKSESQSLRKNILNEFLKLEKNIKKQPKDEIKIMNEIFSTIIYLDGVGSLETKKAIEKLETIRIEKLKINESDEPKEFTKKMNQEIKIQQENKKQLIEKYETKYFKLKNTKLDRKINVYKTILKHNIKFPAMYSSKIIEKMFNTGVTKEDKLLVEYNLINLQILKDSIKGIYNKNYIIEFQTTLLDKKNKLHRIISEIDNEFVKEKISFTITTDEFTTNNKSDIYDLMRNGYKFSIIIKEDFYTEDIEKLDVFSYIIISSKHKQYDEIKKNKILNNKIISTQ